MHGKGTMIMRIWAGLAAVAMLASPAMAQSTSTLTAGEWACRMVSKGEGPSLDARLDYRRSGTLDGWFGFEMTEDGQTIAIELELSGSWTLRGDRLAANINSSNVVSATINGEPFPASMMQEVRNSASDTFGDMSGESTVTHLSTHAMVLDEDETSTSCWR
jgi:hypothetical protein